MPPQHSVTAPARYIPRDDPAWDLDAALAELEGVDGEQHDAHPMIAYFSGRSRFDLDAPGTVYERDGAGALVPVPRTPRAYLRPDSRPQTWLLRRLKLTQTVACLDAARHQGQLTAFALGVAGLEHGPDGIEVRSSAGVPISASVVEALSDAVGAERVLDVGAAVLLASQAPTSAEKKP